MENEIKKERQNLIQFIWDRRKTLLIITGAAEVVSLIISLMMTPLFKSTAIVFPAATSTVSFSEQRNAKASAMDFGEEEQAEQLVQILQSSRIRNRMIEQFDLFKNYDISPNDSEKNHKINKEYESHFQFNRTRFGSIEIDVYDKNPELAAKMANSIVDLIDTVKNAMVQERTRVAFEISQRKMKMLEEQKNAILYRMDTLAAMGVVSIEGRANLFQAYTTAKNEADRQFFKKKVDVNLLYGATFDGLEEERNEKLVKIAEFEAAYEQAESDANTFFNHKFVVENAVVADKKAKPKRAVVILVATAGVFFFALFVMLIRERISELKAKAK